MDKEYLSYEKQETFSLGFREDRVRGVEVS